MCSPAISPSPPLMIWKSHYKWRALCLFCVMLLRDYLSLRRNILESLYDYTDTKPTWSDCRHFLLPSQNTFPRWFALRRQPTSHRNLQYELCIGEYGHASARIIKVSYVSAHLRFILQAGNIKVNSFTIVLWISQHPFSSKVQNWYGTNFAAGKLHQNHFMWTLMFKYRRGIDVHSLCNSLQRQQGSPLSMLVCLRISLSMTDALRRAAYEQMSEEYAEEKEEEKWREVNKDCHQAAQEHFVSNAETMEVCVCVSSSALSMSVCVCLSECIFVPVTEKDDRNCGKPWEVTTRVASWEVGSNGVQC